MQKEINKKMEKKIVSQSPVPFSRILKHKTEVGFPEAMKAILDGKKIRRTEWSDKEEYCLLKDNFLMIHRSGKFHAWIVSEGDLLAIDWSDVS